MARMANLSQASKFPRPVLVALAIVFGAATIAYSVTWMYHIRQRPRAQLGVNCTFNARKMVLLVTHVWEHSSAQSAGLKAGDSILALNGIPLKNLDPFYDTVTRGKPADVVIMEIERPGVAGHQTVQVTLAAWTNESPSVTPSREVVQEILGLYPLPFLVVGLVVLFLRVEDRNAWSLALLFASFICGAPLYEGILPGWVRRFVVPYQIAFAGMGPAIFYYFFAVFPASSGIDRRAPWLKWAMLGLAVPLTIWVGWAGSWGPAFREGGRGPEGRIPSYAHLTFTFAGYGLGIASLISNRRAPTAEARRKTKVILWGTLGGIVPLMIFGAYAVAFSIRPWKLPFWVWSLVVISTFLFPLSFAYAVVKHRVLEIPVLLKRSARYVLVQRGFVFLTVLWGVGFTGLFTSVGLSLSHFLPWDTQITLPAVVVAAVSFGSLLALAGARVHQQVTPKIDRAFFRSAYDARVILQELGEQVRAAGGRRELAALLERQIATALHPRSLVIYFETSPHVLVSQREDVPPKVAVLSVNLPELAELSRLGKPRDVTREESGNTALTNLSPLEPECLVPVLGRSGRLTGLLVLGPRLSEEPYSGEDKRLLASVAGQAGMALENIGLAERMAERLEAERRTAFEMEIAKQVQAKLFPQKIPQLETLEYVGGCIQAREVGGDYYDFLELSPGRTAFVLADVAGKGISAALLMANLQANLRSQYPLAIKDLPALLESVNRLFYEFTPDNRYATLFFGDYEDATRRFRYANCGHNPPILLRRDGSIERLCATATVLGLFEDWECSLAETHLAPGDALVLFSDGVTEARSDDDEEFGESRLIETLLNKPHLPVSEMLENLVATVQEFSGSEQEDDLTLLIARAK